MFSDEYGLTQAVLDGLKTMTRRIVTYPLKFRGVNVAGYFVCKRPSGEVTEICMYDEDERMIDGGQIFPRYKVGEIVAIAQSYKDCGNMPDFGLDEDGYPIMPKRSGFFNKMFVKADLMPHHIRITEVKVERLQDISREDCLKEGIEKLIHKDADGEWGRYYRYVRVAKHNCPHVKYKEYDTAKDAFMNLIDEVSGKGAWERNPLVFAYEFELID